MLLAVSPVRFTSPDFVAGATGLVERFTESGEEAVVLLRGAVSDPDVAGTAEWGSGANGDRLGSEAGDDLFLVGVAEVDPGEVGLGLGGPQAQLAQPLLDADALDQGALDPLLDVVLVPDRLGRRRLGARVDAQRLAHRVDRSTELG